MRRSIRSGAWSPEHPNLYKAEVILKADGKPIDGWIERFGVRKWEVRGGNFYLNNEKYFVRGYGDDFIYPLALISPPSRGASQAPAVGQRLRFRIRPPSHAL